MIKYEEYNTCGVIALPRFTDNNNIDVNIKTIIPRNKQVSLYIHIPFCQLSCSFCKLRFGGLVTSSVPAFYIESVINEIDIVSSLYKDYTIDTIHLGGGTPTLLSSFQLCHLIEYVKLKFSCIEDMPISIEGDIDSLYKNELLEVFSDINVNSVSIGVQTFNVDMRKVLGRNDNLSKIFDLKEKLEIKKINFNIDYLYNLPRANNVNIIENDIEIISRLRPSNVDLHPLNYTSCSKQFFKKIQNLRIPTSQERLKEFNTVRLNIIDNGYKEMYIGNYSLNNFSSTYLKKIHGLQGGEYIGLGLGARSYLGDHSFSNVYNLDDYKMILNSKKEKPIQRYVFAPFVDNFITLFPKRGGKLLFDDIKKSGNREYYFDLLDSLVMGGYLLKEETGFILTIQGCNWYQNIMETLLSPNQKDNHNKIAKKRLSIMNDVIEQSKQDYE